MPGFGYIQENKFGPDNTPELKAPLKARGPSPPQSPARSPQPKEETQMKFAETNPFQGPLTSDDFNDILIANNRAKDSVKAQLLLKNGHTIEGV